MLKVLFVALFVVALTGWIVSDSSFKACTEQNQKDSANNSLQDNTAGVTFGSYRDCLGRFVHANHDDILAIFTVILSFSTIFLWIATRELANNAVIASRQELRAYLRVGHPKFGKIDPDSITVGIENGGRTPAYSVTGWLSTHYVEGAGHVLPDGFSYPDKNPGSPFLVYKSVASVNPDKSQDFTFIIDPSSIERCRRKEISLFFYGHVDYIDIFKNKQTTRFCYQYFPVEVGIGHTLTIYEEHNGAT
jgi:hypothetical protein